MGRTRSIEVSCMLCMALGGGLAALGAVSCGSGSGDVDGGADATSSDATTKGDSSVDGSAGDGASGSDAKKDAAVDGGSGCFTVTGSGSAESCKFSTCGVTGTSCSAIPGSTFGSCPAADLVGCCVDTVSLDGGTTEGGTAIEGGTCLQANCYYSADAGSKARQNCLTEEYEGFHYAWQPASP
jgi:hypothetical protein